MLRLSQQSSAALPRVKKPLKLSQLIIMAFGLSEQMACLHSIHERSVKFTYALLLIQGGRLNHSTSNSRKVALHRPGMAKQSYKLITRTAQHYTAGLAILLAPSGKRRIKMSQDWKHSNTKRIVKESGRSGRRGRNDEVTDDGQRRGKGKARKERE